MRLFTAAAAALSILCASAASADSVTGEILGFDARRGIIVLTDRSVWSVGEFMRLVPVLNAGDIVTIDFTMAGEDGIDGIQAVTRL